MFDLDHVVDEAGQALDRHLPAARHQLALHAHRHEAGDQRERDQQPQRAVGEADVVAANVQRNHRLHRELVHRVDLAFGRHCSLPLTIPPGRSPGGVFEIRMTFTDADAEPEEQHQQERTSERSRTTCPGPNRSSRRRPEHRPGGRTSAAQIRLVGLGCALRVRFASASLHPLEPLFERIEPCIGWKLWVCSVSSVAMSSSLCVAPAWIGVRARARNMAAIEPAKARPLYEPAPVFSQPLRNPERSGLSGNNRGAARADLPPGAANPVGQHIGLPDLRPGRATGNRR